MPTCLLRGRLRSVLVLASSLRATLQEDISIFLEGSELQTRPNFCLKLEQCGIAC